MTLRAIVIALAIGPIGLGLVACEGIGLPVVGPRPIEPPTPRDQCFAIACDSVRPPHPPRWSPTDALGVASASCPSRRAVRLDANVDPASWPDLRCADVTLELEGATLDLRGASLEGARLELSALVPSRVLLAGSIAAVELHVRGPLEVRVESGAIGASLFWLERDEASRAPTLSLDGVLVTDSVIDAGDADLVVHASALSRVWLGAEVLSLEVGSCTEATLRAQRLSLLDATLVRTDLDVETLVAAAGELNDVDVTRCTSVTLAVLDVLHSRIAACELPLELVDVDVDGSSLEGDVHGRARIRRSALRGERVALEDSRLTLAALCGVQHLDVRATSVECPSCEPRAPAEICGASTKIEPYCPGYELAPCDGAPRPPASDPDVAP